jgi:8-oxo-dGTP pyrophosphatase MutT (NUDIX family)
VTPGRVSRRASFVAAQSPAYHRATSIARITEELALSTPPQPVTAPVPAGTIILLRDRASTGLELFMVVRHHQIDFASGALVFPGGKIDAGDEAPALAARCDGSDPDPVLRAIQIGAIREAFEEAGVLLARPEGSDRLIAGDRLTTLAAYRQRLNEGGAAAFAEMLARERLRLACDALVRFAHWITPAFVRRRYDTHFFLAETPHDQVLLHDGQELVDSLWISPQQVLDDARHERRTVVFPTLRNIEKLARANCAVEALNIARTSEIVTVEPWTEVRADGTWLCIPPEAGYPVCEDLMRNPV